MNDYESNELRSLAEYLFALAEGQSCDKRQDRLALRFNNSPHNDAELCAAAQNEIDRRACRERFFPSDMFAEGGWNILLDLFVCEQKGKDATIMDACIASRLPHTTALRHITLLIQRGFACRRKDDADKRREFLMLTHSGRDALRGVLAAQQSVSLPKGQ